jgi:hypothetical protein
MRGGRRLCHAPASRSSCASSARRRADQSRGRGNGITRRSAIAAARWWLPGGRPRRRRDDRPLPGATPAQAGSATRPLFGVRPELVDAEGKRLEGATDGNLVIPDSWPARCATVWGDHARFFQTYFQHLSGSLLHRRRLPPRRGRLLWITGPGRRRDQRFRHRMGLRRSKARWWHTPRWPRPPLSACPMT